MPTYQITVPDNAGTIKICVNKGNTYLTSFEKSLAGKSVFFNTDGLREGDSVYFASDGLQTTQVIWGDVITVG
tara:strand:- start:172 stop:390 length:219 start_codon:yes stop_codon:yes gene_type:complete